MRRPGPLVLAACILSLGGCMTTGQKPTDPKDNESPFTNLPAPTSMEEAHHFGQELVGYYSRGFEKANNRRRLFNVGIWAATTYTTGAAGLGAHADNIFLGALTGTSLGALEPVVNEGGPEAWVHALGKTACLSQAATTGLDAKTLQAVALIEARVTSGAATAEERDALAVYQGAYRSVGNGYNTVYAEFLTRRTGRAISKDGIEAYMKNAQEEASRLRQAAAPAPPPSPSPGAEGFLATDKALADAAAQKAAERLDAMNTSAAGQIENCLKAA